MSSHVRLVTCEACSLKVLEPLALVETTSGGHVCNACVEALTAVDRGLTADGIDVDHLLAEHLAACAELRRLRARNSELEQHIDELRKRLIRLGDWRPL